MKKNKLIFNRFGIFLYLQRFTLEIYQNDVLINLKLSGSPQKCHKLILVGI